jgi:dihydroorotase
VENTLTITQPDDWHVHVRDGELLSRVIPFTAQRFRRALVMPNLVPPVRNVDQAMEYRARIMAAVPDESSFDPKMSLYLTDMTGTSDVEAAARCEHVLGFKLYPAGATTNSSSGVSKVTALMPVFETMASLGVVLQVHGEVTDPHVDVFDREAVFIEQILLPLHHEIPELRMVLEHITTSHGVDFVTSTNHHVGGTITPQHLMFNRNELFRGVIRPHMYCLPVLKRESHRVALVKAATGGDPSFFLGTDSAPHTRGAKESDCGCAGIFSACAAIEYYAEIFDCHESLDKLEGFASHNGADFYRLERNTGSITLIKTSSEVPFRISSIYDGNTDDIVPLMAGESLSWSLIESS